LGGHNSRLIGEGLFAFRSFVLALRLYAAGLGPRDRDEAALQHFVDGYRRAGLPE